MWERRRALAVREARRVLGSSSESEDCAQDVLVSVLARPEPLASAERPDAWLTTVARRRAIDRVRQEQRRVSVSTHQVAADPRLVEDLADAVADRLAAEALAADVHALPRATRAVLGHLAQGQTTAEAAEALGISKRAADSHLHRARIALRSRWSSALAASVGLLAVLRRPASGATAVAAVPIALLLAAGGQPVDRDLPATTGAPTSQSSPAPSGPDAMESVEAPAPAVGIGAVQPPPVARAGSSTSVPGRRASQSHRVARVAPAPRTAVELRSEDDGEDTPAVEAVQRCLEDLVVTTQHIGC